MLEKGRVLTPKILTDRFNCSDKTARNMINKLRELGYEIDYCKSSKKYIIKNTLDGNCFTV